MAAVQCSFFLRIAFLLRTAVRLVASVAVAGGPVIALSSPAAADSVRNDQWQVAALDAQAAWKLATGEGVVVAVVDSGVDATHTDLAGQVLPGADFVDGTTGGQQDPVGHGTTVAGLIAGRGDDTRGVVGVAPKAKILPVRVLNKENRYDDPAVVARGVRWAVDHGASVVNLSFGGQLRSDVLADALGYAARRDVVIIACTGNVAAGSAPHEVWYPAREAGVVAVAGLVGPASLGATPSPGATAQVGGSGGASTEPLWPGSLTGPQTVLTAPAVDLVGAKPGGYWRVQGTSFAAPLVAATATLVRSRYPSMSAANVINRLIRTARDLGPAGRDDRYGYGEVDPLTALRATDLPAVTTNPLGGTLERPSRSTNRGSSPTDASGGQGSLTPVESSAHAPAGSRSPGAGHADGADVRVASRTVSTKRQLGTSVMLGGVVAAVLLVLGLLVIWRRERR
jgi:type VII secretion-associated serine protease mycosin